MVEKSPSSQITDHEGKDLWGKYVEIRLKDNKITRGLVIAQAGDSISICDEFRTLEEYQNYKPQIMGSCGVVYPHTEAYKWSEVDGVEILPDLSEG
ncbi:MAG: hypothetical protein ABID54_03215 [Pseudomonadota bacterium]